MSICDKNNIKEECSKDKYNQCDFNDFKRARYFHGMLMTDRDFREEQIYHNEKRKLLNRTLHGWGVVCGLSIEAKTPNSSVIKITPGMALDCHGNEIIVCKDFEIDLKKTDPHAEINKLCPDEETEYKYYVAIKYTEVCSDRSPVYAPTGGCEEKVCEYTRIREGFCVNLFKNPPCCDESPTGFMDAVRKYMESGEEYTNLCNMIVSCPECCCDGDPFVVLGSINFKETNGKIDIIKKEMISINDRRRYVLSPMLLRFIGASKFSSLGTLLNNPFIQFCQTDEVSYTPEPLSSNPMTLINKSVLKELKTVNAMTEDEAKRYLDKQEVNYNKTISLSRKSAQDILVRAMKTEKIKPKMNVDLVIDDNTKKALFYVPTAKVSENEEIEKLSELLGERERVIKDLNNKIANITKRIDKIDKPVR